METIVNSINRLLPIGKKFKKYLPFFLGIKLLSFGGFLALMMINQMILPSPKIAIALLLISTGIVFNFEITFNSLKGKKTKNQN